MKSYVSASLALLLLAVPASAQVFRPETVSGAVLGGVAGAVIGNNSGDLRNNAWRGAAIGTVAGALIGAGVGEARDRSAFHRTQVPVPSYPAGHSVYAVPAQPASVVSSRPNYAVAGTLLGGLAGAIIGHNDGRHGWEGAAYGAGAGLLLGALAEREARSREAAAEAAVPVYTLPPQPAQVTSPEPTAPASALWSPSITGASPGATGSMSSANRLFGR